MTSIIINKKSPSQELVSMILNFGRTFGNAKAIHDRIMEKGKAETFSDFEITMLAREILKDVWTKDQLSKWFPTKPKLEDSSSKSSTTPKNDDKKDTENSDTGKSSEDEEIEEEEEEPEEEPQTESGKEAMEKFNSVFPPEQPDITNHPMYQRLQTKFNEKIAESNTWQNKFEQLAQVEGKRSFVSAKDEMNHISGQSTIIMLIMELQKRRNEWKKVKYLVEVVT